MKNLNQQLKLRVGVLAAWAAALSAGFAASPSAPPATVTKEQDLVIVTLTEEAKGRLRLEVAPVVERIVPERLTFAGQIVVPLKPENPTLSPLLTGDQTIAIDLADRQTIADGRVKELAIARDIARIAMARAEKIHRADAASTRSVDEASAALQLAEAQLEIATLRRQLLGDNVEASIENRKATWIQVPIYTGEAPLLAADKTALVTFPGQEVSPLTATPISGPRTASRLSNTVDWYYSLPPNDNVQPGEWVRVDVPTLRGQKTYRVIPFNSVVHDIHGGQWVYEQLSPQRYVRRRVQVLRVAGAEAVLKTGPSPGTLIVTQGTPELFGTEFFTGK